MTNRVSPWFAIVLLSCVFVIPVFASLRPVLDPDIWWHLRAGQWIVAHGQLMETDPFASHGSEHPWIAYSWLFEVLLWNLYHHFGLIGILVYRVALSLTVVLACQRLVSRNEPRFLLSTVLAAVAALALVPLMSERPWMFTILFTTLTLDVILDVRRGRRRWTFWMLPVCYVLWANLHIQFVYGLLLLILGCIAPCIDRVFGGAFSGPHEQRRQLMLTLACILATLLNPYDVQLYGVVLEYATQQVPFQVVAELSAPDFGAGWDWLALGLLLATTFVLGRRQKLSSFEVLLVLMSSLLWLRVRRDMWLVVLAALVVLPGLRSAQSGQDAKDAPGRGSLAIALCLAILLTFLMASMRGLTNERLAEAETRLFPARAAKVVAERGFQGVLYNDFDWGGYLIWKLPNCKVSMDGRTNLHGDERMRRSFATWEGRKGWETDRELRAAGLIFANAQSPLASLLRLDADHFELIYEDEQAVLFVPR